MKEIKYLEIKFSMYPCIRPTKTQAQFLIDYGTKLGLDNTGTYMIYEDANRYFYIKKEYVR